MSKKFQLQIPTPCHENWDNMSPVEKGRFCSSCQKQVVDFSKMSDREVAMFFKKPSTGSVCGRFMQDQLNRDIAIPKKRIPWLKYFFHILLPGLLVSMKATAQGKVKVFNATDTAKVQCTPRMLGEVSFTPKTIDNKIVAAPVVVSTLGIKQKPIESLCFFGSTEIVPRSITVTGKIINEKQESIPFATVSINGTQIIADSAGYYQYKAAFDVPIINIKASSAGYFSQELDIETKSDNTKQDIMLTANETMKEVTITSYPEHKMGRVMGAIAITKTQIINVPPPTQERQKTYFKFYPNPIKSNSTLHIEWNKEESGYNVLQLFNLQGQLVFAKEIFVDDEARLLSIDLPSLTTGSYLLKMTNKQTSRSYTGKILVE